MQITKPRTTTQAGGRTRRDHTHLPASQHGPQSKDDNGGVGVRDNDIALTTRPREVFMSGGWGDIHDAAAYMGGVSAVTVRREIGRGRLQAFKIGGRKLLRLKREHCDGYLLAQQVAVPVK